VQVATYKNALFALTFGALVAFACPPARSQQPASAQPSPLLGAGITQQLNQQVPADLVFRDEAGKAVRLGDYFGKKPIVLSLVYFNCPFMCTEVLNGELRALQGISLKLGQDYEAVTVSFDPKDGPPEAGEKSQIYSGLYGSRAQPGDWHFLTGQQDAIQALTNAVGFHYTYDAPTGQFAHATAILILTPDGRVSRYFYGVQYPPRDVRLALVEASGGKIGSLTDSALLFCFHYDPQTGKYGLLISNVLRIAGVATMLVLGLLMFVLFRSEKHRAAPSAALGPHTSGLGKAELN